MTRQSGSSRGRQNTQGNDAEQEAQPMQASQVQTPQPAIQQPENSYQNNVQISELFADAEVIHDEEVISDLAPDGGDKYTRLEIQTIAMQMKIDAIQHILEDPITSAIEIDMALNNPTYTPEFIRPYVEAHVDGRDTESLVNLRDLAEDCESIVLELARDPDYKQRILQEIIESMAPGYSPPSSAPVQTPAPVAPIPAPVAPTPAPVAPTPAPHQRTLRRMEGVYLDDPLINFYRNRQTVLDGALSPTETYDVRIELDADTEQTGLFVQKPVVVKLRLDYFNENESFSVITEHRGNANAYADDRLEVSIKDYKIPREKLQGRNLDLTRTGLLVDLEDIMIEE